MRALRGRRGLACCAFATLTLVACSHDWDAYDPGRAAGSGGGPASSSASQGGAAASGTASSSASSSASSGGGGTSSASASSSAESSSSSASSSSSGGGGAPPMCPPGSVDELVDDFEDGVIDPLWSVSNEAPTQVNEQGGALTFDLGIAVMTSYSEAHTVSAYNLVDCAVFTHVTAKLDPLGPGYTGYLARLTNIDGIYLETVQVDGVLHFRYRLGGGFIEVGPTIEYEPISHAYWRFREESGTAYWETSPDASAWTIRGSHAAPFDLSSVQISLTAGTYDVADADPGLVDFEAVNVVR
jgi:hypothetical protein